MKKKLIIAMLTILSSVLLVACACDTVGTPTPSTTPITTPMTSVLPSNTPDAVSSATPGASPATSPDASTQPDSAIDTTKMTSEVEKLSEVKKAVVAAMGDTALVGLEFDDAYQGTLTARITEMVTERIKAADSSIDKVHVTADQVLIEEIGTFSAEGTGAKDANKENFDALTKKIEPAS